MTLQRVRIRKQDGQTGVVKPGEDGICAIISVSSAGVANRAVGYLDPLLAYADFQDGPLAELADYEMVRSGNAAVLVKSTASTAGTLASVLLTGTGTSVPTAHSGAHPFDDYPVLVTIKLGGTIGTGPITYNYSLDGGKLTSGDISLGVATTIVIPNSGVQIDLAAGTLVTGDTITAVATGPKITTGDLTTALEALRVSSHPWEWLLIDRIDATAGVVTQIDTFLASLETDEGLFRGFSLNSRFMNAGESEADYNTALTGVFASAVSIRGIAGADCADYTSSLTGLTLKRPTSLFVTSRLMGISVGTDPAYVALGPLPGAVIMDDRANPIHHNELKYPGLEDSRLTVLRTYNGRPGTYCEALVLSGAGSDYVFPQHIRCMNKACEIAYQELEGQLSRGVPKQPEPDKITGAVYIQEGAAREIESFVQGPVEDALKGQVSAVKFRLSRIDDLGSNQGVTLHATIQVVALAYVKGFLVDVMFERTIAVS